MKHGEITAADEWRAYWPIVVAAVAGFSLSTLAVHSMGLFLSPMGEDLRWTRAEVTSGLTIYALLAAPLAPFAGALLDRIGSRRLALPGIVAFSGIFAAFAFTTNSLTQWWALWTGLAISSLAIHTVIWTSAVARRFVAGRGLALGLTLCGTSITQVLAPQLAYVLVESWGWRSAYLILGLGWGGVSFLLVFLFLREPRTPAAHAGGGRRIPVEIYGLTLGQALRSVIIWRIAITELLGSTVNLSLIVHMVPMLVSMGTATGQAASIAGLVGVFAIGGKLAAGWVLDRVQSQWVPSVGMWLPACSCVLLASGSNGTATIMVAAMLFGAGVGAYFQIVTYLSTRYAGLAHFGKIFGIMGGFMALGTGIGPLLAGYVFDSYGSYRNWQLIVIGMSVTAGFLVAKLGPYPDWSKDKAPSANANLA